MYILNNTANLIDKMADLNKSLTRVMVKQHRDADMQTEQNTVFVILGAHELHWIWHSVWF